MSDPKDRDATIPPKTGDEAKPAAAPKPEGKELAHDDLDQCIGGIVGIEVPEFLR